MNLEIGLEINLMLVTAVPRGKFVKIQPHETAFIDLPDPRAVYTLPHMFYDFWLGFR